MRLTWFLLILRTLKTIFLLPFFALSINKLIPQTKFDVIGNLGNHIAGEENVAKLVNSRGVDFISCSKH